MHCGTKKFKKKKVLSKGTNQPKKGHAKIFNEEKIY